MEPADVPRGPLLIDTDVFSYLRTRRGRHKEFGALVEGHVLALSFASCGEILALGHRAGWGYQRVSDLRAALRSFVTLPYDSAVVDIWAPLHARLRGHLHGQGTNDLWTVACALAQAPALPIVTNSLGDFTTIGRERADLVLVHPDL